MNIKKYFFFLCIVLLCNTGFSQESNWYTLKDLDKEYRVDFPFKPIANSQPIPTAVGEVTMQIQMLDQSKDSSKKVLVYMTAYTVYPENSADYEDPVMINNMLDGSVSGAVNNVNGSLISSNKGEFNGYKSVESKIGIQSGSYIIHMKSILVKNKLYMIQTIYSKDNEGNNQDKKFFDSFELIKTN